MFRGWFNSFFGRIKHGSVEVVEGDQHQRFGVAPPDANELSCKVTIADAACFRRVLFGSTIGAAESYIDGQWGCDDLTTLIRIMIRNLDLFHGVDRTWARTRNLLHFSRHLLRRNTVAGSRKNIHEHYDLGNDFYRLFLDPTLSYSSAVFASEAEAAGASSIETLHEASVRKLDLVRRKLEIGPDDQVVEIGTGWGAMAIHLASTTGCRVTTTTISEEQYRHATEQVAAAGLADRVTVLKQDYRNLEGQFDKLVSIEMIEAVGHQFFDQFFATCDRLLKPGGRMLLQAIMIAGQHYQEHIRKVDFIRRYIFPGGCLPSNAAVMQSIDRATDLQITNLEDFTLHYAATLLIWRGQFKSQLDAVRALGHDNSFIRLWHFYLCYCEAAFMEHRVNLVQMTFQKRAGAFERGQSR
jgi:cyclopropane-fatty-acyl-phospholipid synthase